MTRRTALVVMSLSLVLLAIGLMGASVWFGLETEIGFRTCIYPAIPLAWLSIKLRGDSVTEGFLWVSGHGPAGLNLLGIVAIYVLPALAGVVLSGRRLKRPTLAEGRSDGSAQRSTA